MCVFLMHCGSGMAAGGRSVYSGIDRVFAYRTGTTVPYVDRIWDHCGDGNAFVGVRDHFDSDRKKASAVI